MPTHRSPSLVVAHIDGASRGNPGPAAYGVHLETEDGSTVATLSKTLHETTNNVAEYHALLAALDYALEHHIGRLKVLSDSELLARQVQGIYKVRSLDLKPLHERARKAIAQLESFSIQHVPREQNREADRLANKALNAAEKRFEHLDLRVRNTNSAREPLRASASFRDGSLKLQQNLPLTEGEEVELEIRRKS
jgi:ribonuclease HI